MMLPAHTLPYAMFSAYIAQCTSLDDNGCTLCYNYLHAAQLLTMLELYVQSVLHFSLHHFSCCVHT